MAPFAILPYVPFNVDFRFPRGVMKLLPRHLQVIVLWKNKKVLSVLEEPQ